ncbi:Holliday junction resolvase RuvX [Flexibacterium corallicola]|uniref:Holliday junction resolvase RuvX n=1 Tax=Flexibacterium corallicola TaxID=3037259 RepID=UPI00286EEF98|nr:Holliday junction resolvase RuvX [Pseudovibrio sp. M1P-2-3]
MANDPTYSTEEFEAHLQYGQRVLGMDLGTKTIGLALSDMGRRIASPLETIKRKKFTIDTDRLLELCAQHQVCGLVLGLPLNMDGTEGPRAQATRAFARNLAQRTDIPITYWDERLSTAAVTRTLIEADRSRARRSELVDKMAASYILQGLLDRLQVGATSFFND